MINEEANPAEKPLKMIRKKQTGKKTINDAEMHSARQYLKLDAMPFLKTFKGAVFTPTTLCIYEVMSLT